MGKTADRMPEQEELKIASGIEKMWRIEEHLSNRTETRYVAECSKLSAQQAAAKIWAQWKLFSLLSIKLNAYLEIEKNNLE